MLPPGLQIYPSVTLTFDLLTPNVHGRFMHFCYELLLPICIKLEGHFSKIHSVHFSKSCSVN